MTLQNVARYIFTKGPCNKRPTYFTVFLRVRSQKAHIFYSVSSCMFTKGPHILQCFYVYVHKRPTYFTVFLRVCSPKAHLFYSVSTCMFTKGPHILQCFYVYVHKWPTYITVFLRVCSQKAHIFYSVSTCMFTKGPHILQCFNVYVHKVRTYFTVFLRVCSQCFSAITGSGPAYFSELLHVYTPYRTLRSSSDTRMLEIQQYKRKTHGFRTFSYFGPHIWNSLPQDLRHCSTLSSFKAKLKTFLFSQYFHPN